jgi:hypothetical protein
VQDIDTKAVESFFTTDTLSYTKLPNLATIFRNDPENSFDTLSDRRT